MTPILEQKLAPIEDDFRRAKTHVKNHK